MAYDPQRDQPRRRKGDAEPSPVDSLLDGVGEPPTPDVDPPDTSPPPSSSDQLGPTGSWSDRLLYSGGFSAMIRATIALMLLGWLWRRWTRRTR